MRILESYIGMMHGNYVIIHFTSFLTYYYQAEYAAPGSRALCVIYRMQARGQLRAAGTVTDKSGHEILAVQAINSPFRKGGRLSRGQGGFCHPCTTPYLRKIFTPLFSLKAGSPKRRTE